MNVIERYLHNKYILFIVIGILCFSNLFSISYFVHNKKQNKECVCEECPVFMNQEEANISKIKVDIKGYVKKPGVYEVDEGSIINDLIKKAGGLKSNGTTDHINLSKKLNNEDMIVVLSKNELKKQNSVSKTQTSNKNASVIIPEEKDSVIEETTGIRKKISLNTSTKEELMTLNGIGEAKALAIISYRDKTPFQDITEIMNVSGIGESVYEKIKDCITI